MVITPNVPTLSYVLKDGVKHFELVAEQVELEILPGIRLKGLGYNGSIPGPTIMVYPGDQVNIRVSNQLDEGTSVHWHGLDVPNAMDGVPCIEPSPVIPPNYYYEYRFTVVNPPGTHMYHSHFNSIPQIMGGLAGAFIILDPPGHGLCVDRDYFIMLHEFHLNGLAKGEVKPGLYDMDPYSDMFNFFTMNGRCFPHTESLPVKLGDQVRIRLGNLGMHIHPIHLHGHPFSIIASDGNPIGWEQQLMKSTIPVAPGETYDILFQANNPGIWPFHCHMPHHMANNFTKSAGGMFTTVVYRSN
ncbi:copper oxidase [Paenibacillus selenitireducens]|uniref:Copper oxidase n=1 Tax=Paenibacillus selenitireducens TaxID=1324314 RepID=A0A1T2XD10_9BACL|nr:multicopper oxidase domain-containing protein [Paenibacillus selenitireducens]OPA77725.1 copper oxidase [Paenibacillus selenitireducens]